MIKLTKSLALLMILMSVLITGGCVKKINNKSVSEIPQSMPLAEEFDKSIDTVIKQASIWQELIEKGRYNEAKGNLAKVDIEIERATGILEQLPPDKKTEKRVKQLELANQISSQEKWILYQYRTGRNPDIDGHGTLLAKLKGLDGRDG